jgi:hypothetical protein
MVPDDDALLRRAATAKALTEAGFQTSPATLATKASRGGGPPYRSWGRWPLYRWGDSLAWAQSRLSRPRRSTSEANPDLPSGPDQFVLDRPAQNAATRPVPSTARLKESSNANRLPGESSATSANRARPPGKKPALRSSIKVTDCGQG